MLSDLKKSKKMQWLIDHLTKADNFIHQVWFIALIIVIVHILAIAYFCSWAQRDSQNSGIDKMIEEM